MNHHNFPVKLAIFGWLLVWNIWIIVPYIYIWDVILPIDFHIFQDG